MPKFSDNPLITKDTLDRFKYEIAEELGLMPKIRQVGWGDMTSRECGKIGGKIGGNMVKVMIRYAEQALNQGTPLQ
ncbi:MAG TPA: alpha/beta-type small acid-soluble spore protein [Firmicutes bacterium]|nr:alpha/beta-type small acid-soluble spore protein [Bacillota bacterium]